MKFLTRAITRRLAHPIELCAAPADVASILVREDPHRTEVDREICLSRSIDPGEYDRPMSERY
jgi:hypothetical protein